MVVFYFMSDGCKFVVDNDEYRSYKAVGDC